MEAVPAARFARVLGVRGGVCNARFWVARIEGALVAVVDVYGFVSDLTGAWIACVDGAGVGIIDRNGFVEHATLGMARVGSAGVAIVDFGGRARDAVPSTVTERCLPTGCGLTTDRLCGQGVLHAAIVNTVDLDAGVVGSAVRREVAFRSLLVAGLLAFGRLFSVASVAPALEGSDHEQ